MIGLFDSGVGGLSILQELRRQWPQVDTVYFADTAHVPYGGRPQAEIRLLALNAVQQLLAYQPELIVIACNTATSVAITDVRAAHPEVPIVGVVPVVKTLAERTRNGKVAVVATPATLSSATYAQLKVAHAANVEVLEIPAPEWVMLIEHGEVDSPAAQAAVQNVATQIQIFGADVVALGSTHFPWLRPMIERLLPGVQVLDSGSAVARHVIRILSAQGKPSQGSGQQIFLSSGDPASFAAIASRLLGEQITAKVAS
jgi:glutamate racemase